MDFFEHQSVARKRTKWLVFLFALAVLGVAGAVYGLAAIVLSATKGALSPTNPLVILGVLAGTLLVVFLVSSVRIAMLAGPGGRVAGALGGTLANGDHPDPAVRRLLNIVEEMAIASGVPVPPVYVLERESGINAFAAGHSPRDAAIGVSRGAIDALTRDEMQGVIAHEFSHILNGDMRMNLRLVGFLAGIVFLAYAGRTMLYAGRYSGRRKDGAGQVALIGLGLVIIGSIGAFFGALIKSMVSRQREYLADASAVQFTRNPEGIANALKKIGGWRDGGSLRSPAAGEFSHFFFARANLDDAASFESLFATHPPLRDRIKRIEPSWDGKYIQREEKPKVREKSAGRAEQEKARREKFATSVMQGAAVAAPSVLASIGTLSTQHVDAAHQLIERVPEGLRELATHTLGGATIVCALASGVGDVRTRQIAIIAETLGGGLADQVDKVERAVRGLPPDVRFVLIDLACPALAALSSQQYSRLDGLLARLAEADGEVSFNEWALRAVVRRRVGAQHGHWQQARTMYYGLRHLAREVSALLSAAARAGHADEGSARRAFESGAAALEGVTLEFRAPTAGGASELAPAVDKLEAVSPKIKRDLIRALALVIAHDRRVTTEEAELLRAIGELLGVPVPVLVPGQTLV